MLVSRYFHSDESVARDCSSWVSALWVRFDPDTVAQGACAEVLSIVACGFSSTIGVGLIISGAFASTKIGYKGVCYLTFAAMTLISVTAFFFTCDVEKRKQDEVVPEENAYVAYQKVPK